MVDEPERPSKTRVTRVPSPEERAAQVARAEELTTRDVRRSFMYAIGGCVLSLLIGLAAVGWAMHTTDAGWGRIAFLAGLFVGYTGIVVTLARYYLKGERAGWW